MDVEQLSTQSDIVMQSPTCVHSPCACRNLQAADQSMQEEVQMPSTQSIVRHQFVNFDVSLLTQTLVRNDAATFFAQNCKEMAQFWTTLLSKTTLSRDILCRDGSITEAFNSLDQIIITRDSTALALRLAYAQLPQLFNSVRGIVATNKRKGLLQRVSSKINYSIVMEMYWQAQKEHSNCDIKQLQRRLRLGHRWLDISGGHPLLLVTYNDEVEKLISNFSISKYFLQSIAAEAISALPSAVVQASAYINQIAHLASMSGDTLGQLKIEQCIKKSLSILSELETGPKLEVATP